MPVHRRFSLLVVLAALGAGGAATIAQAPAAAPAQATATAFEREGPSGRRGELRAEADDQRAGARTAVQASTRGRRATATARAERVNLFDGLVTASAVDVEANAGPGDTRTSGVVTDLAIAGKRVAATVERPHSYELSGYGELEVLATGGDRIVGLRARLTRAYKGHSRGDTVTVGYAAASVPRAAPAPDTETTRERETAQRQAERRTARPERRARAQRAPARRRAPELEALRTARGYAFPVHAGYSYSNDWGAPRERTGTHEGNDIFAATGTPVLAVADGRLFRVGTRKIPGNRVWLKSEQGDTLFYGHLSAFAEDARNGAEVEAGDVIGFVGSTGDAEQTPPHLHFEIHPRGGEATNPYPFLRAWETRRDVPPAAWLERYGTDPGSRPGSLVVIDDYLAG